MNKDFVVIDVETANPDISSICQIGIAEYKDGNLVAEWETLVDPEDYFDEYHTAIHGIKESDTKNAPKLPDLKEDLHAKLLSNVVVCHTHFDRASLEKAHEKYGIDYPCCTWLDSARVARRAWTEFAWNGYGLANIAHKLGYKFKHHNALEDAKAAGYLMLAAMDATGFDINKWLRRVERRIGVPGQEKIDIAKLEPNSEGSLYGEILVFTGSLTIPRSTAAEMAAAAGCRIGSGVNKETTLLVVGNQDIRRLAGSEKSSKHRKAEDMILNGHPIKIVTEDDFKKLIEY